MVDLSGAASAVLKLEMPDHLRNLITDLKSEIDRLRLIERAACVWRSSMENDGWTEEDIESGICRPGIAELMKLLDGSIPFNATRRLIGDRIPC